MQKFYSESERLKRAMYIVIQYVCVVDSLFKLCQINLIICRRVRAFSLENSLGTGNLPHSSHMSILP